MAIIQAVFALISRSLGRVAGALFGWAVEALFGTTSGAEKIQLSVLVGTAAAWPILVLGIVWPKAIALVLAFVPIPAFVPSWTVRLGWLALAVAVPFAVGIAMATRARGSGSPVPGTPGPPPPTPLGESKLKRMSRGVPTTLAIAASFAVVFVSVPAAARRPIATHAGWKIDWGRSPATSGRFPWTMTSGRPCTGRPRSWGAPCAATRNS